MSDSKQFLVRVDGNLLEAFQSACKKNDTTASQEVRAFMREYVRKNGQQDFFKTKSK
jgi:hypothetical protein